MQAAGGIDYMVLVAGKALRARPKSLNFVAPYVRTCSTILTGTGNTFFSLIPVINQLAYANKIRPERALAGSAVASTFGITASPWRPRWRRCCRSSRSTASTSWTSCSITVPASIVGIFVMAFFVNRHGKDLEDDAEYLRRLDAGEIEPPAPPADIVLLPNAKRSVAIFLGAVALICIFGVFEDLRPTIDVEGGGVEPMSVTPLIQMLMLSAAAIIVLFCKVHDRRGVPARRSSSPAWSR